MRRLLIPGTDLETSRFIFGTSSLFRAGTRRTRRRLLEAAIHHGFLHFDTAPYYGFGMAERDLAPVLKAHPEARVTTKVGLYSPGGEEQSAASVRVRKIGGRVLHSLARPVSCFELGRARLCLEGSLRRLGRECIDIYMLHEPELFQVDSGEWLRWLEARKAGGQIRHFGLALTAQRLHAFLESASPLMEVVQVQDSLSGHEADLLAAHGRPLQITYGYVSGARAVGDDTPVPRLLELAMQRNPRGPIIVGTSRIDRVGQYSALQEIAA